MELKEYIEGARKLEEAKFEAETVRDRCSEYIKDSRPAEPVKEQYPEEITPPVDNSIGNSGTFLGIGICILIVGMIMFTNGRDSVLVVLAGAGFIALGGFLTLGGISLSKTESYAETQKTLYEEKQQKRNEVVKEIETKYNQELKSYTEAVKPFDQQLENVSREFETELQKIDKALEEYYSNNIIFPKYRNLVALSSISEYLQSGRCSKLEGADGAYNMYEAEIRQNRIIEQLSLVIERLDQIRNTQYYLYTSVEAANQKADSIIWEMKKVSDYAFLTAYFTELDAKINASPKYVDGIVW